MNRNVTKTKTEFVVEEIDLKINKIKFISGQNVDPQLTKYIDYEYSPIFAWSFPNQVSAEEFGEFFQNNEVYNDIFQNQLNLFLDLYKLEYPKELILSETKSDVNKDMFTYSVWFCHQDITMAINSVHIKFLHKS